MGEMVIMKISSMSQLLFYVNNLFLIAELDLKYKSMRRVYHKN